MPKKKDSPGKLMDERFDTLENKVDKLESKVDDGFKTLLKMHFDLETKMDKRFDEMDVKLDKVLSAVSNLVVTVEGVKQDVAVIGEHVRQHEDRLSVLEK